MISFALLSLYEAALWACYKFFNKLAHSRQKEWILTTNNGAFISCTYAKVEKWHLGIPDKHHSSSTSRITMYHCRISLLNTKSEYCLVLKSKQKRYDVKILLLFIVLTHSSNTYSFALQFTFHPHSTIVFRRLFFDLSLSSHGSHAYLPWDLQSSLILYNRFFSSVAPRWSNSIFSSAWIKQIHF